LILDRYLVKQFFPIFLVAMTMFVLLLALIDLFANLWRYLNFEVSFREILRVSWLYLPKCLSYALPLSLLFASAYTLGDLYARNELTSIFSSGIPFWRFSLPLVFIGLLVSIFSFFFDDILVIPTLKMKNDLSRVLLHQQKPEENNSNIVIKSRGGHLIYSVDFYDYQASILNGLSIIEEDEEGNFVSLVRSSQAHWSGDHWVLSRPLIYRWVDGILRSEPLDPTDEYREAPETFRRSSVSAEDLPAREARLLVQDLQAAGLPFTVAQAEYYHRFSFASASLVVMILSISMGGRFRKNILLMSLLSSLSAAVVFYVMEMISMMMAKLGYIPTLAGAWFPVIVFIVLGIVLLQSAKT
jgi:lipopolysaccharide export system permease protein